MAIDTKLNTVENGVSGIRDAIQNINSNMGKGHINTLDDDIEKLSNQNNFIHKVLKQAVTETTTDPDTGEETTEVTGYNYVNQSEYVGPNYTAIPASKYRNNTELSEVIIPNTVTTINGNAFYGCTNLNYINLENVTRLYNEAFYNTSSLNILNMPKLSGFVNGGQQFRNSGIIEIQSLGTITSAPDGDLNGGFCYNCKSLETVNLPDTLTKIAKSMFYGCSKLKTVNCNNVTRVDNFAFINCSSLSDFERFDICTFIGTISFQGTRNLKIELSVPNLTSIGVGAFYNSRITKILDLGKITTLPDVGSYTQATFGENPSLTEVHLPSTLTKIGKFTFSNNTNLTTIVCLATTPPSLYASAIRNYATNVHFYVPYSEDHSILAAYKAATNWASYSSRIHELNSDGSIPT